MSLMKLLKLYTLIAIGIIPGSYSHAQTGEYEKLESVYSRLYEEDKKDSMLLVARQMNAWALKNEGDTSLRYAVSFRYIGNSYVEPDSSLLYYNYSLDILQGQGRFNSIDGGKVCSLLGNVYLSLENHNLALDYAKRSVEIFLNNKGEADENYAASLIFLGSIYWDLNEYSNAIPYFDKAASVYLKNEELLPFAVNSHCLGLLYFSNNDYKSAIKHYLIAEKSFLMIEKQDQSDFADLLRHIGICYSRLGEYDISLDYYHKSLDSYRSIYGTKSVDEAELFNNIGVLYSNQGEHILALKNYNYAAELLKSILGETHTSYLQSIENLAILHDELGNYELAEKYFNEIINVIFGLPEFDELNISDVLDNFGSHFNDLAKYREAASYFRTAYELRVSLLGKNHLDCARSLTNLGVANFECGRFAEAIDYLHSALSIFESHKMQEEEYFTCLNNLASIYAQMGDLELAENYYNKVLNFRLKKYGYWHPSVATSFHSLGNYYWLVGDNHTADSCFQSALSINIKNFGRRHVRVAECMTSLGNINRSINNLRLSNKYYLRAKRIFEKKVGRDNVRLSNTLQNLGIWYADIGKYRVSNSYLESALNIRQDAFGSIDPKANYILYRMFINSIALDDSEGVKKISDKIFGSAKLLLESNEALTQKFREDYKDVFMWQNQIMLNYLMQKCTLDSSYYKRQVFENWVILNCWVSANMDMRYMDYSLMDDTLYVDKKLEISQLKLELFNSFKASCLDVFEMGKRRHELEMRVSRLENEISLYTNLNGPIDSMYSFHNFINLVRDDEAFIDILALDKFDFVSNSWSDTSSYVAFVITSETNDAPIIIELGTCSLIDQEVFPYLMGQITESRSSTMDGAVYDYLWKPLETALEGKRHVYFSPGGIYHSLNPETIFNAQTGKFLYEEKDIHLVSSGRSFVDQRLYGNRSYSDQTAFLVGSPDFDGSVATDSLEESYSLSMTYSAMRDLSNDGTYRANSLPATGKEVAFINNALKDANWKTQLVTGKQATESNLKRISSPRVLHIATHGFFMEDVEHQEDMIMRMLGMDRDRVVENPLLRSGLLLSGCNETFRGADLGLGSDNGILTAYEAGLLDLRQTELVVLSACETGKGEIRNGEGIHGLRKAITDAGAEHILMSLWKVDDKVTSEYMQTFYGHYAQGKSIRESYNLTRNEIKQKYPQPYYWGAFVLVGE
jgi:tetratricopeptide (TPR) repeat protein/CHAT domain-containing protein